MTLMWDSDTETYSGPLSCKRCGADWNCEECHDGYEFDEWGTYCYPVATVPPSEPVEDPHVGKLFTKKNFDLFQRHDMVK